MVRSTVGPTAEAGAALAETRVCPYLRGRHQAEPILAPSPNNHCILAASIHLPSAQQSRYCLGGQHPACSRFQRQQMRPLPRYVTGIPTPPAPILPPRPALPTLWWRRPWGRTTLRVFLALALVAMIVLGWRWRSASISTRFVERPPLPIPAAIITPTPVNPYLPPRFGPPAP